MEGFLESKQYSFRYSLASMHMPRILQKSQYLWRLYRSMISVRVSHLIQDLIAYPHALDIGGGYFQKRGIVDLIREHRIYD